MSETSTVSINPGRTLGELVAERPSRSRVFEQIGLDYCCGGKGTLAESCARKGLAVAAVVAQLTASDAVVVEDASTDWTTAPLGELCDHIVATHHAYLRTELPRITALTAKVAQAHGEEHPEAIVVRDTYAALRAELESHMGKEEMILFPLCKQLDAAADLPGFHCGSVANPIRVMEYEHENAGAALATMSSATSGYNTPEDTCSTYRALMDALQGLELDLHQHIHKENNILFPRAIAAEAALAGR